LLDQFDALLKEKQQAQKARARLFDLYETEGIDQSELATRLSAKKQEILEIEGRQTGVSKRLNAIRVARENDKLMAAFIRDKEAGITRMLEDMERLEPADKKRVVESIMAGNSLSVLMYHPEDEHTGADTLSDEEKGRLYLFLSHYDLGWSTTDEQSFPWFRFPNNFLLHISPEIFEWLFDEGKISPIGERGGKRRQTKAGSGGSGNQLDTNTLKY
jgi:hypothetical protein